jgi:asparagine synthase (glutamine-hydrolysing)
MQLAEDISPEVRFDETQPKKLLVDSFSDLLPRPIWDRSKMGFTFPLQQWMREHREINDESLYRGRKAKNLVKRFKKNTMHWSKIFALYQIQMHA